MSSSILSLSESDQVEDGPPFGRYSLPEDVSIFPEKSVVLRELYEIRENVRHNGTSLEHGAPHGAITRIIVSHGQVLSFIDNHGRVLLVVSYDDSSQALLQVVALIEAMIIPTRLIERAELAARHDWPITFCREFVDPQTSRIMVAGEWSLC